MNDISYFAAWLAGLGSFFTPCVFPLVPAYLANLAGTSAIETDDKRPVIPSLIHSISFVLGFSIVLIAMGAAVGKIASFFSFNSGLLQQIAGVIISIFGVFLIASIKIPWLNYEQRLHFHGAKNPSYIRSFLIGCAFSVGWTPCLGPIIGSIVAYCWKTQDVIKSATLLAFYSFGLGIPFILMGLAWGYIAPMWRSLNRHLAMVTIIGGIVLMIVGILIFFGVLEKLMWSV